MGRTTSGGGSGGAGRRLGARRRELVALVLCCATAVGVPLAGSASRPPAAVGAGLDAVLEGPASPPPAPVPGTPSSGPEPDAAGATPAAAGRESTGAVPALRARPATPEAVAGRTRALPDPPVEVRVPSIGALAPVDALGVDADGAMALPEDVRRAAWYRYGPAPGSGSGTAVLAGHVASRADGRGALADLPDVDVGDPVEVVTADGDVLRYRVATREAVVKDALPVDELFADGGPERLVLLTCGGPYLRDLGTHRDNVVVVAEPA